MIKSLKKISFWALLISASLTITSCKPEATLSVSVSSVDVSESGSEASISITTNTSWSVSGGGGWCSAVPSSGNGPAIVRLIAVKNNSNADRATTIMVTAGSLSSTVTVNQKQNSALILTKKVENIDNNSRAISVELKSNIQYDIIMPAGVNWITKITSKAFDTFTHEFLIAQNSLYDNRSAIVIFKDKNSSLADTLTINQSQINALILTNKAANLTSEGGTIDVELRSNVNYDIIISAQDNWITVLGTKGLTTYTRQLFVSANSTFDSRTGKVIFRDKNSTLSDTLIITQQKLNAILLNKDSFYIQKTGGTFNYILSSNIEYDVTVLGGAGWLTNIQTKGLIANQYNFVISANTGNADRSAKIVFLQKGGNLSDTLYIKQTSFDGYYVHVGINEPLGSLIPEANRNSIKRLKIEGNIKASAFTVVRDSIKFIELLDLSEAKLENDKVPDGALKFANSTTSVLQSVVFPENLITIGKEAFYNCAAITSLNLPNSLITIDDYAFCYCYNLSGNLILPNKLETLGSYAFSNCIKLYSVELPKSLKTINSYAFSSCSLLAKVYTKIELPFTVSKVFSNINSNADLIVPVGTQTNYQLSSGWGYDFFRRIYELGSSPEDYLIILQNKLMSTGSGNTRTITLDVSSPWVVDSKPSWVTPSQTSGLSSGAVQIRFDSYSGATVRRDSIVFKLSGTTVKAKVVLEQYSQIYEDGSYLSLQSAGIGNGVNIVFIGDGFSIDDINSKKYENSLREAYTHFFAIEPYKSYSSYFNAYMVYAFSKESGISDISKTVNTTFETMFTKAAPSTSMSVNTTTCFTYAQRAPIVDINKTLVVLVANSTRYAGTCWMYSNGKAVAICPMSKSNYPYDFRGVVQHEACGHGFGKLADEYVTNTGTIIQSQITSLKTWQGYGHYLNVDVTNNLTTILWKHFVGDPAYSYVGAYEGAYYYPQGVWRPENRSIMINNIKYLNAPSREMIVKRIKSIAGMTYSFEEFKAKDVMELSAATKAADYPFDPTKQLSPPVLVLE